MNDRVEFSDDRMDGLKEFYVDIRCKVLADDIDKVCGKMFRIEEAILNDDNVTEHFIKSIGVSLKDRDNMVGD